MDIAHDIAYTKHMETIVIHGRNYNLEKRIPGEKGKTNTLVYLTRPKGKILHLAAEYQRENGTLYYSTVSAMHGHKIK